MNQRTFEIFQNVTIRNKNFFQVFQSKSLLAYSGGKDSTLLLHYYLFLNKEFGFPKPALLHLQHCIRQNDEQEKEIYEYMKSLNLEIYFYKKNIPRIAKKIKKTSEETGRIVRYILLKKIAKKNNYIILTAHHTSDYLESVFINLIRGGGVGALSTLPILNENLFRPLLLFKYSELQEILALEQWKIFEDHTNTDESYLRNRIRKYINPFFLKEGLNLEKLYWNFHEIDSFEISSKEEYSLNYVKVYLPNFISTFLLKQIIDSYLKYLKLHPINSKVLIEIRNRVKNNTVVYVENKETIFWKAKSPILYIIPKNSKSLKKPEVLKNEVFWNGKVYPIEKDEVLSESIIGKKISMRYGHKEISEILREKNIPEPVRKNIPAVEKNNRITKILLSLWDEDLKDIHAHETKLQD